MTTPSGIWPPPTTVKPQRRWLVPTLAALVVALAGALAVVMLRPTGTETPVEAAEKTTEAPETATVGQYAGLVYESAVDIRDTAEDFDRCHLFEGESVACAIFPLTLDVLAKTLVLKLTGAQKLGAPAYIGPPPAEIARLVDETIADAEAVDEVMDGPDPYSHSYELHRLLGTLDRWEPYL